MHDIYQCHYAFSGSHAMNRCEESRLLVMVRTITTQHQIPEDDFLQRHRRENLKSYNRFELTNCMNIGYVIGHKLASFGETRRWTKSKNPLILSVTRHRQNSLEYTSK
jgi:hypothetical protein